MFQVDPSIANCLILASTSSLKLLPSTNEIEIHVMMIVDTTDVCPELVNVAIESPYAI